MMAGLAAEYGETKTVMIPLSSKLHLDCRAVGAPYLKAHRTATSIGVKFGRSENDPADRFLDGQGVGT